jgi:ribosomal protein L11 methyltransferase
LARRWPALDVRGPLIDDTGLLLAAIDHCSPTALEEHASGIRIFFATAAARDDAADVIATLCRATPSGSRLRVTWERVDVSDDDWAERSQQNLPPVTVGCVTIFADPQSSIVNHQSSISLIIPPSMAFGTGHHATTRLCLAALQTIDLTGRFVLDVGTGSGVLALAAAALGAAGVLGIDNDADALAVAGENLIRNPHVRGVEFRHEDLRHLTGAEADVVVANLTGALIASASGALLAALRPGGHLVVSGVLADEFESVARAFGDAVQKTWSADEDGWIGAGMVKK